MSRERKRGIAKSSPRQTLYLLWQNVKGRKNSSRDNISRRTTGSRFHVKTHRSRASAKPSKTRTIRVFHFFPWHGTLGLRNGPRRRDAIPFANYRRGGLGGECVSTTTVLIVCAGPVRQPPSGRSADHSRWSPSRRYGSQRERLFQNRRAAPACDRGIHLRRHLARHFNRKTNRLVPYIVSRRPRTGGAAARITTTPHVRNASRNKTAS